MESEWKLTLTDFLLGGAIIAAAGYFVRHQKPDVAAITFCSPLGFVYLYLMTYYRHGAQRTHSLSKWVLISSVAFTSYMLLLNWQKHRGLRVTLVGVTVVWIAVLLIYIRFIQN
jgi:hypothetical protein